MRTKKTANAPLFEVLRPGIYDSPDELPLAVGSIVAMQDAGHLVGAGFLAPSSETEELVIRDEKMQRNLPANNFYFNPLPY